MGRDPGLTDTEVPRLLLQERVLGGLVVLSDLGGRSSGGLLASLCLGLRSVREGSVEKGGH